MDESLDALIEVITAELSSETKGPITEQSQFGWTAALVDAVTDRF
ncbi:MAG TPA: hypothetical protein VKY92_12940 [Verrucomicrobiae bacterium]|nr:hypothetical protein [Verrucomicrobiae bacterium]